MAILKSSILQRKKYISVFTLQCAVVFFLLLFVVVGAGAEEVGFESRIERCRAEILAEIKNSLPDIEELSFADSSNVSKWLAASDNDAGFTVMQVGCWNRKNGIVPVQVKLSTSTGKEVRRWFKIRVNGKEQVLLANRNLVRGEPVQRSDFSAHLVDCQDLRHEVVSSMPEGMIYQLTCNLRAGEPLSSKRLQPFRLIKRGDLVRVLLQQGGVRIHTRGVAMGNGTLKELITVKNPKSRKYYQARVVGSGEVVVVY